MQQAPPAVHDWLQRYLASAVVSRRYGACQRPDPIEAPTGHPQVDGGDAKARERAGRDRPPARRHHGEHE
jgi:hypothetical protein